MKTHLFISILFLSFAFANINAQSKQSQDFPDTLNISIDDNLRLMVVSANITKYEPADTLNKIFEALSRDLLFIEIPELENRYTQLFYTINNSGHASIRFKDVSDNDKIWTVLENGETLPPMPIEIILNQDKGTMLHVYLTDINDLDLLPTQNIPAIISEVIQKQRIETPEIRRIPMTATWNVRNGVPGESSLNHYKVSKSGDMIQLSGTVGASLIRNTLVPSIDLILGVNLAGKTGLKHMIHADLSMNYIFNEIEGGGFSTDINTFIGINYFINTSKNSDKSVWVGGGISYLAWQNGDFFEKNTWRLTIGAKFGDRFSVMPELYIGDNFNKLMPGLKFRIMF